MRKTCRTGKLHATEEAPILSREGHTKPGDPAVKIWTCGRATRERAGKEAGPRRGRREDSGRYGRGAAKVYNAAFRSLATSGADYGASHHGRNAGPERNIRTTEDQNGQGGRRFSTGDVGHADRSGQRAHAGHRKRGLLRHDYAAEPAGDGACRSPDDHGAGVGHIAAGCDREGDSVGGPGRSEEHTSELQSQFHLVCRLLLEKKKKS